MRWEDIQGQERAVKLLKGALARGHAHHAYLLAGPEGTGKELLARTFAQAANCEAEDAQARPCGRCASCRGIERGNFPDVMVVMPQAEMLARGLLSRADLEAAPSRDIRVDDVRALARRLSFAALRGRRKIAIVLPADAMNERAQNTLLKTLEEPPPSTTFLLVSANPDALLPTIRSRCARVQLGPVPREALAARLVREGIPEAEARERAARAQGSFSRALQAEGSWGELLSGVERALAAPDEREALDLAEACGEREAALEVAEAVHAWTRDLLVAGSGGEPGLRELAGRAREIAGAVPPRALLAQASLCAEVIEALRQNGNGRLQIERLLLGARELRHA
ncbi:MAG TPA: DNA polymerase III subunit delta' [Myxococcales bacterium]|nr:DNA polymerase III subunit delta' [Myxococcales bacterium]